MFYLLDQGFFRRPELAALIEREPDSFFVVTDTALIEMLKGDRWADTLRGSLAPLAVAVDRVFGSVSISEAIRYELDKKMPVDRASLLPSEITTLVRRLVAAAGNPATFVALKAEIEAVRDDLLREQVRPAAELSSVIRLANEFVADAGSDFVAGLRRAGASRDARLGCVLDGGLETLRRLLPDAPRDFVAANPIILRFIFAQIANVARWHTLGGLGTAKPDTAQNDRFDREYVVIASYFDRILARDSDVITADMELRALLSHERRTVLEGAYREIRAALRRDPAKGGDGH